MGDRLAVEGDRELVAVLAVEEVEVSLVAEGLGEGDAGLLFGGGGDMTGAVGSSLYDMHHTASTCRITADIERVCSHQNAAHRIDSYVKFHFCHRYIFLEAS